MIPKYKHDVKGTQKYKENQIIFRIASTQFVLPTVCKSGLKHLKFTNTISVEI